MEPPHGVCCIQWRAGVRLKSSHFRRELISRFRSVCINGKELRVRRVSLGIVRKTNRMWSTPFTLLRAREIKPFHAKASLDSSSTSGDRGRCTSQTRIKLTIISSLESGGRELAPGAKALVICHALTALQAAWGGPGIRRWAGAREAFAIA